MYNQDVFFILTLFSFLLVAILKGFYWKHSKLLFMGVFAQRYANQYLREENTFTERVNWLTFLLMSVNFTMVIAKVLQTINLPSIFLVFVLVVLFFFLKIMLINFFGFLFKVKDLSNLAVFFSILFDKTLGFILFPVVVMIYFFIFDVSYYLLLASLYLFIILLILKLFWFWKIGTKSFGLPPFYIFLYLCIFEIFPLLLLGKRFFS